jgi:predicted NUDIX family NTP pyrophosphohydrolase
MAKQSAGLLVYRKRATKLEVLLVHPGGPFWRNKDAGAWSIPKGEFSEDEEPLAAAKREFLEELGSTIDGTFVELKPVKQRSGKTVYASAVEADLDVSQITSNTFKIELPRGSGQFHEFPEVDRAEWFDLETAKQKINTAQCEFLNQLERIEQY